MKIMKALAVALVATASLAAQAQQSSQEIQQRKNNQQGRIGQGVQSGQLTPHETSSLEHRESSINREEHAMRHADDGHLTRGDKAALNRRQNRTSAAIYRDKHNSHVR
jgi:Ni/Co efflux regulator RcnB